MLVAKKHSTMKLMSSNLSMPAMARQDEWGSLGPSGQIVDSQQLTGPKWNQRVAHEGQNVGEQQR